MDSMRFLIWLAQMKAKGANDAAVRAANQAAAEADHREAIRRAQARLGRLKAGDQIPDAVIARLRAIGAHRPVRGGDVLDSISVALIVIREDFEERAENARYYAPARCSLPTVLMGAAGFEPATSRV